MDIIETLMKCLAVVELKEKKERDIDILDEAIAKHKIEIEENDFKNGKVGQLLSRGKWRLLWYLPVIFFVFVPILAFAWLVFAIIMSNLTVKKHTKDRTVETEQIKERLKSMETKRSKIDDELECLLESPEYDFVEKNIPPDYIEGEKIKMFIYFFRNGYVKTMQEAVIAYDNFEYQSKMQELAVRTAEINQAMERDIKIMKQEIEWLNLMDWIDRIERNH